MMRSLLFIMLLFSVPAAAQRGGTGENVRDFRRVRIGIQVSPDICYRDLSFGYTDSYLLFRYLERKVMEVPKVGYSAGLNFSYYVTAHLGLEAGILYADKGYRNVSTAFMDFYAEQKYMSYKAMTPARFESMTFHFHYLEIPLSLRINIGKRRIGFTSAIGCNTDIFLFKTTMVNRVSTLYERQHKRILSVMNYIREVNFSPFISLGLKYRINDRMDLSVEPVYTYGLLDIRNGNCMSEHLWNAGLHISYSCGFN